MVANQVASFLTCQKFRQELTEKEITAKQLLNQIDSEADAVKKAVMTNVDTLIMPTLKKLRMKGTSFEAKYFEILQMNVEELTSSFGTQLDRQLTKLTPREIEICNMVKNGLTVKEIAQLLHLSARTVEAHRANIRKKLQLCKSKTNLTSYLKTLA